jgi:DnaJ-class molecular chaperone
MDDNPEKAMDAPFLITASELQERQTIRRRKFHLSTRSEIICQLVELGLGRRSPEADCETANGGLQMGVMKGSKIKEHVCPACNGTGYPVVKQPVQPGRKIYPVKCTACDGKGKVTDAN